MRLRAFDLLVAFLASTLSITPSTAVSLPRAPRPQNHFYVAKSAHPGRDHHPAGRQLYVESTDSRTRLENWVLEDYVLVSTVEGELYSLDRHSGDVRWGLSGGEAVVDAVQLEEVGNATNETLAGREPRWIVQPVDGGQLYLFDKDLGVLVRPFLLSSMLIW
jgi:serine/threonine-protein kinase/endoribonuclease IRE1